MGELYKLDFDNGKSYIGITTKTAVKRFKGHRVAVGYARASCTALYRAWQKYGEPTLTVLSVLENSDLKEAEVRAISAYGTLSPDGYNLTTGGDLNTVLAKETRLRMSAAAKGRPVSEAAKAKLAVANKGNKYLLGHVHSVEARAKMSISGLGKVKSAETRAKMSQAQTGNKKWLGRKHSAETRSKMSAAKKGNKHALKDKNEVFGD